MNLTPELVSAAGIALTGILGAWNHRQGKRLKALEDQVGMLTSWKLCATSYIGLLRFSLQQNGITPPPAPKELGLETPAGSPPADEESS